MYIVCLPVNNLHYIIYFSTPFTPNFYFYGTFNTIFNSIKVIKTSMSFLYVFIILSHCAPPEGRAAIRSLRFIE